MCIIPVAIMMGSRIHPLDDFIAFGKRNSKLDWFEGFEDVKKKKRKKSRSSIGGRIRQMIHLRDFLHSSSMHGLKYAADKEAPWVERFLWIGLFVAGFCTAVFFILRMWVKWQNSPVLISVESTDFPNYHLPFPTVSICSVNHASDEVIRQMLKTNPDWKNLDRRDVIDLMASMMNRGGNYVPGGMKRIKRIENEIKLTNLTSANITQFMASISQPCPKMAIHCLWGRDIVNCSDIIKKVPSSQGFCCVFNLQTVHINMEKSSNRETIQLSDENKPPLKAYGEGVYSGLTVVLNADVNDYAFTSTSFFGFKVLVHNPEDQPDPSSKGIAVSPGVEVFAAVRTASIFSTEEVRRLPIHSRGCRYSDENNLKFFSRYSQSNCWMEHIADYVVSNCSCLPYYFLVGDASAPTCSSEMNPCIQKAIDGFNLNIGDSDDCPVNCNGTAYWTDVTQGTFPNKDFMVRFGRNLRANNRIENLGYFNESYVRENAILLHVFYHERSGIQYKRDTRYDWQDFVSAVGGLLGLGVGFSLLSLMEIIYFFGGLRSCFRREERPETVQPFIPMRQQRHPMRRIRLYY